MVQQGSVEHVILLSKDFHFRTSSSFFYSQSLAYKTTKNIYNRLAGSGIQRKNGFMKRLSRAVRIKVIQIGYYATNYLIEGHKPNTSFKSPRYYLSQCKVMDDSFRAHDS